MKKIKSKEEPHLGGNIKGGDPNTFYPDLWKWMIDQFKIKSVLDVGCGEGHSLLGFKSLGVERILGIEGLRRNVDAAKKLGVPITLHDFSTGPLDLNPKPEFDLCWSCEFVEHVREEFASNFVDAFTMARYVAITHAVPGQRGHHHVNCQKSDYWIDIMAKRGFTFLFDETTTSRARETKTYWPISGLIFKRR